MDKLCDVAASAGDDKSPISAIEKIEGSFSKALLMRKENRTELIAKIPCPNRGPSKYTTESEVAVLQYSNALQVQSIRGPEADALYLNYDSPDSHNNPGPKSAWVEL